MFRNMADGHMARLIIIFLAFMCGIISLLLGNFVAELFIVLLAAEILFLIDDLVDHIRARRATC